MLTKALAELLTGLGGEVRERGGTVEFTRILAERRVFLSRKKLVYRARLRVDDGARAVHLSESLSETGSGLAPDSFDHGAIRKALEALAREHGYTVQYHITGI